MTQTEFENEMNNLARLVLYIPAFNPRLTEEAIALHVAIVEIPRQDTYDPKQIARAKHIVKRTAKKHWRYAIIVENEEDLRLQKAIERIEAADIPKLIELLSLFVDHPQIEKLQNNPKRADIARARVALKRALRNRDNPYLVADVLWLTEIR